MSDIEQHCVSLIIKRIVGCDDDKAIEAAAMIDRYYTAPGATTKSDGGVCAGGVNPGWDECPECGATSDEECRFAKSDVEALAATTAERPGTVTSEPEPSTSDPLAGKVPCHCHDAVSVRLCLDRDRCYTVEAQSSPSDPSSTRSEETPMTTPKQALEAARTYVDHAPGSNAENTLRKIDEALASLEGDAVERVARAICQSGKFETGQGTCALICMDQLGDVRKKGCSHCIRVHGAMARAILATGLVPDEAAVRADSTANLISIIADIREKTGLGGKPMLNELADAIAAEIDQRVADEREKCAKVAEAEYADKNWHMMYRHAADVIAAAIRSGGAK